jgi:hypothetical protein
MNTECGRKWKRPSNYPAGGWRLTAASFLIPRIEPVKLNAARLF